MKISNNVNINISAEGFQTASESPSSPPVERAKTQVEQQAPTSKESASSFTGKAKRLALLEQIQEEHAYEVQLLSGTQTIHNWNVDKVHEQIEAFIEKFFAEKPDALSTEIRDGISSNLGQILKDAQLDISCYRALGNRKAEYGKHLIFSSLSVPLLKDAPLCFQLFHFKPGQTTPVHHHPNPAEDSRQTALVECASYVVEGMINERLYDGENQRAEKTSNSEDQPATTVHAYTMDGISDGQTVAVQSKFDGFENPKSAVYLAYDALVEKVKTGGAKRVPVQEIAAKDLLTALKENKFGANPVIVDIRESKEVQRHGVLHIEGANMVHVPRGVAIAKILKNFPDSNTHLVLSCRDGARSALLADELRALGYKSTGVADGAIGCAQQGLMKAYDASSHTVDKWNEELDLALAPPALTEHIQQLKSSISAIPAEEWATGLEKGSVVVFDVRQENEQSSGVIPNAQRVLAGEFEKKARFHAHDLSTPIAIYSGGDGDYRALIAARNLMEMGYSNVKYLEGGYKNHIDQGVPDGSPSSEIPQGTKEIEEEQESPLLSAAASTNHDFSEDLEWQNSPPVPGNKDRQAHHIGGARWSPRPEQAQAIRNRARPITLDDLQKSREVLFSSKNLAARMLGTALERVQTQFKNGRITPMVHVEQCSQILEAAKMLYGSRDVEDDVLRKLNLDKMTRENNALTKEEYFSIMDDVDVQLDAEHGVDAVLQRKRAADRHRRAFLNLIKVDSSLAKITTKGLSHACDAAASTLSYSAAALSNSSLYKRSMASGASWTTSAALNSISRALSDQDRTVVGLLSDAADFGAGIVSMAAAGLSHESNPNQKAINYAATSSNVLWITAGMLASVSAIQSGRRLASQFGMSALAYTAIGLSIAGDWANVAAAGVGIASTATSDGSNSTLNKFSAGIWMAGTVLSTTGTILRRVDESRQEEGGIRQGRRGFNRMNQPTEIEIV